MKRTFVIAALALALVIASAAHVSAGSWGSSLQGEYSFVGSEACVQNKDGFDSDYKLLGDATTRTSTLKGELQLYRNGKGNLDMKVTNINHNENLGAGQTPTSVYVVSCDVTQEPLERGTIEIIFGECKGNYLPGGGGKGNSVSIKDMVWAGEVSPLNILLLSDWEPPSQEEPQLTVEYFTGGGGAARPRICTRSITAIQRW